VLSTPPAFVLSQDQTLHKKILTPTNNKTTDKFKLINRIINAEKQPTNTPQKEAPMSHTNNSQQSKLHDTLLSSQTSHATRFPVAGSSSR
jgi:hypothetical protein